MKKSELKEIIKECIYEILFEGLGAGTTVSNLQERKVKQDLSQQKKHSHLDSIEFRKRNTANEQKLHPDLATGMFADIFADTAQTTLREQGASDTAPGRPQMTEAIGDPLSIFEGGKNWGAVFEAANENKK